MTQHHIHGEPPSRRVSRRDALKVGAFSLAAPWLGKAAHPLWVHLKNLQVDRKRIYIAPDDHTDYMWSADEATYRQAFLDTLDYYLNLADSTSGEPSEHQSRWNCDGNFWMWTYEKNRTASQFQRLMDRIRDGHISVPLNPLCVSLGGTPLEAVLRGMYYPGQIERRFNLRFRLAYMMEDQTQPCGLTSLWAGSGALFSWKGICGCASMVPSAWDRQHDIYWAVGPDGSRVLMKWNSMLTGNMGMGGYAEARNPANIVEYVDSDSSFIARYPYRIIGAFGKGWDDLKTMTNEFVTVAKGKTNTSRLVIVSSEEDFFRDFEAVYGSDLPSLTCTFGNEWELYVASLAEVSARVKRALEKLRAAEAMAALVSIKNPSFMEGRQAARNQTWVDFGLYWEHCWTADGAVGRSAREAWHRRLAAEIETYTSQLHQDAATALGSMIQHFGTQPRFYAFNPLGWSRTDFADIPYADTAAFHVVDLFTGQEVPSQIVTVDGERRLRILAKDVPPVGYRVFEIRPGAGASFPPAANVSGGVMENAAYRVTVAGRGAITSLIDKGRGNREFARQVGGRTMNDLGSATGTLEVENAGPVSVTLRATSSSPLQHTSRVTLIRDSARIDIRNDITQNFGSVFTWGFGINLDSPDVWHEEVGAVIHAKLLGQGGHYSPRNARYDWLTLNHFADISSGGLGATLSNADCYYMKLGNSSTSNLDASTPLISPLVGGQVDGTSLGINNQGGDTHFLQRFALQTHDAFDPAAAMRFALEHQNPFVANWVGHGSLYPEKAYSFIRIDDADVVLWALKPADDGIDQGVVARAWNLAGTSKTLGLSYAMGSIDRAQNVSHIETPVSAAALSNGKIQETMGPKQIKTALFASSRPTFDDVPFTHWAHDYIEVLYRGGFVAGYSTEPPLYGPDLVLSRAESAVFILRGVHGGGYVPGDAATQIFGDVALDSWAARWANALYEQGYTAGCNLDPLLYCTNSPHTRAEACVFFLRVKNGSNYQPSAPQGLFTDVALDAWYAPWVEAAFREGLLPASQDDPSKFVPEGPLTRDWAAYMMVHAKHLLGP